MVNSMTGFAARKGEGEGYQWRFEMRAVNGRGFDLRLRIPDWIEGLEQGLRAAAGKAIARGNVSVNMKVERADGAGESVIDADALARALAAVALVEARAGAADLALSPVSAADVLAMRGVVQGESAPEDTGPLRAALMADFAALLADFNAMRAREGEALAAIVSDQLARIGELIAQARTVAEARAPEMAAALRTNLARVLENSEGADPDRVAQELALIAVKADVREELDRLDAHVDAARELIAGDGSAPGPVGRKLDFLSQEFMREANTLCSKAQSGDLTRIGLDLKALIEQMREQIQNIE